MVQSLAVRHGWIQEHSSLKKKNHGRGGICNGLLVVFNPPLSIHANRTVVEHVLKNVWVVYGISRRLPVMRHTCKKIFVPF